MLRVLGHVCDKLAQVRVAAGRKGDVGHGVLRDHLASPDHSQVQGRAADLERHVGARLPQVGLIGQHGQDARVAAASGVARPQPRCLTHARDALLRDVGPRLQVQAAHRRVDLQAAHVLRARRGRRRATCDVRRARAEPRETRAETRREERGYFGQRKGGCGGGDGDVATPRASGHSRCRADRGERTARAAPTSHDRKSAQLLQRNLRRQLGQLLSPRLSCHLSPPPLAAATSATIRWPRDQLGSLYLAAAESAV